MQLLDSPFVAERSGIREVSQIIQGKRQILWQRYCDQHRIGIVSYGKRPPLRRSTAKKQTQNKAVQI